MQTKVKSQKFCPLLNGECLSEKCACFNKKHQGCFIDALPILAEKLSGLNERTAENDA